MAVADRNQRGMSLIEVVIALGLLSLIAVLLLSTSAMLTRRQVLEVTRRAEANTLATRYLEMQRTQIHMSSLIYLADPVIPPQPPFTVTVRLVPGRVGSGYFEETEGIVTVDGQPVADAAVRADVRVTWEDGQRWVDRSCILVPREN